MTLNDNGREKFIFIFILKLIQCKLCLNAKRKNKKRKIKNGKTNKPVDVLYHQNGRDVDGWEKGFMHFLMMMKEGEARVSH
jgi:hypothetical protein